MVYIIPAPIGVINQAMTELRRYAGQVETEHCKRLEVNIGYLIEVVIPYALKLDFLDGVKVTFESSIKMYMKLTRKLSAIENRAVPTYNSEPNVQQMLRWDEDAHMYVVEPTRAREFKRRKSSAD